jgi:hypothetical protein
MNKKAFVVGGARGGGGSNFTGSWSGTQSLKLVCQPGQPASSGGVTMLSFIDRQTLSWTVAPNATVYDILGGDVQSLRADGGAGSGFCNQDDFVGTQVLDDLVPEPGQCLYYVIRGDSIAPAPGTYDGDGPPPVGQEGRDAEVGTTGGRDCTHR